MSYVPFAVTFENPKGDTVCFPSLKVAIHSLREFFGDEEILKDPGSDKFTLMEHSFYQGDNQFEDEPEFPSIRVLPVQVYRYLINRDMGLREAKDLTEAAFEHLSWCTDPQLKQFYSLIRDRKVSIIKLLREAAPPVYTFKKLPL